MKTLAITCPNCGDPAVPIPLADLEGLHSGVTIRCPQCRSNIVFGVFTPGEYKEAILQSSVNCRATSQSP